MEQLFSQTLDKGVTKMNNKVNLTIMFIGLTIMVLISINAIIDSFATDLISSIPPMIFGAALFVAGYIKYEKK